MLKTKGGSQSIEEIIPRSRYKLNNVPATRIIQSIDNVIGPIETQIFLD